MTPHPLPGHHGRHGRSPLRLLAAAALAAVLWGLAPAAAGEAPGTSDVLLARSALAALDADPQLRDVNLVVSVVDRVAVIGGPVPTADTGRRAAWVVQRVQGIAEVKNRCFVQAGPDPLIRAVADRVGASRPPLIPELPPIVGGPRTGGAVPPPAAGWEPPAPAAVEPPRVSLRPSPPPADSVLLPPVASVAPALPPPPRAGVLTTGPAAPTGAVVAARPGDVLTAAAAARTASPRFAALTVELRDGTLVIGGSAARAADAWEFAQTLRQLPGVARVAVGQIEVR